MISALAAGIPGSAPEGQTPRLREESMIAALRHHGARGMVLEELQAYCRNQFAEVRGPLSARFPLSDEPFVADWERYAAVAEEEGVWSCLRERFVQLRFPVAVGTSRSEEYLAATRRGVLPAGGHVLELLAPESLLLWLHPTPVGRIPVLLAPERADFVSLVQALTRRNEPEPIPDSMGACIVAGYNNWDRVHRMRRDWLQAHPGAGETEWYRRFREIVPQRDLYQDRFILLSGGWYSSTPPEPLGVAAETWSHLSITIRLEHECAHYFTLRVFGSMRNTLHDELIADYAGITAAIGHFRADWLLRFLGLEDHPVYRRGGRLENYRGEPPLSDGAMGLLRGMVVNAAEQLEQLEQLGQLGQLGQPEGFRAARSRAPDRAVILAGLASLSLPELALPGLAARLESRFSSNWAASDHAASG